MQQWSQQIKDSPLLHVGFRCRVWLTEDLYRRNFDFQRPRSREIDSKHFYLCHIWIFPQVLNDLSDSQQLYLDEPIERSKLKKVVIKFWAEDPYGKREIFLDGKKVIYAIPGIHCDHDVRVIVTSRPKPSMYTNEACLISAGSSGGGGRGGAPI